ncbi:MAG: PQQ-binding-like beta-propeller repeat protein, partial [Acidobacteriota bacterium]|nr:PQQ-binding-like beta-propeller repeat protein [Acidobacteriota bacterium]
MKRVAGVFLSVAVCSALAQSKEWPTYGHDPESMRFSPLTQITPANVSQLTVGWVYHMRPAGAAAVAVPPPPARGGAQVGETPDPVPGGRGRGRGRFGNGFAPSQVTPLVIDGVMYMSTPYSRVVALEPTTGKELWAFRLPSGNPSTRGVEYWPGDGKTGAQIVFGSNDGKLYSVDAKTGKPNDGFGDNGMVNLNTEEILQGLPGRDALSSPPVVYKNFVITGGMTQENPPLGPAGDVRAWDMRTGKLAWSFHSIPKAGEKYNDTWAPDSWKKRSGVNVWGLITVDAQRGIVYMPFGAPSVDQYGG